MRDDPVELFRKVGVFADVDEEVIRGLAATSLFHTFPEGVELVRAGDRFSFLYGLVSGRGEVKAEHNGVETILHTVMPGMSFCGCSVLLDEPAYASFATLKRSEILMIPTAAVRDAVRTNGSLAHGFCLELARMKSYSARELLNQKLRPAVERLAIRILRAQANSPESNVVEFGLTKRQLAAAIGASPETLSRALNVLRKSGVDVNGSRFIVVDPAALRDLARPSSSIDGPL